MSLATSAGAAGGMGGGGGAALSTAAMAHGGPSAMQVHQQATSAHGQHAHHAHAGPAGVAPPGSLAALAADVVDKSQNLTVRGVRGVAGLPIVGVDLYGEGGECAAFPPMEDEDEENDGGGGGGGGAGAGGKKRKAVRALGRISTNGTDLVLKRDDDAAHRAVRRLLTKGRGYEAVLTTALADDAKDAAKSAVVVRPHLLLGSRRTAQVHPSTLSHYTVSDDAETHALAEESELARTHPVTVRSGTLDGGAQPQNDDFDRVAFHLRVHSGKKALTMLPEEAVSVVVSQAKRLAQKDFADDLAEKDEDVDAEDIYSEVPTAIPVPGWACADASVEALLEACGTTNVTLYQRSVAAVVGSLLPLHPGKGGTHKLLQLLGERINDVNKERQKRAAIAAARNGGDDEDDLPTAQYSPLVIFAGTTTDGLELMAVQLGKVQDMEEVDGLAPFGDVKVVTSVSVRTADALSEVPKAFDALRNNVDEMLPELFDDDHGPVAVVTYGSIPSQLKLKDALLKSLKSCDDPDWNSGRIPFQSTREECVACGAAVLAASAHGRVRTVVTEQRKDGKHRAKAKPAVTVSNSSACAVGVRYNYFGGGKKEKEEKWSSDVKVIFDFDRRVPAGPYGVDLSAAECAALRSNGGMDMESEDALFEAAKKMSGSKNIPDREEAALALRVQVVQRVDRDGEWIPVGDPMKPLTFMKGGGDGDGDDDDGDEKKKEAVACESTVLELGLNPVGLITSSLISDGQSVVQATKSARNSALRYYLGIAAAILFFGGFMVKSYVEEKVFERDTHRVLAFYKHAAPGSISDGDERNARYLVWKYKGKKDKLWRRLEAKYGVPVRHAHEWDDVEEAAAANSEEEEEEQNLDETTGGEPEGGEPDEGKSKEEQDL